MANMLRKRVCFATCNCNRHHKPTISWGKRARHIARAIEKRQTRRDIQQDS